MNTPATTPATAGNFLALMQGKTDGVTLPELDAELAKLVTAVQETGRKGTLTYKLTVLPNAKVGVRIEDAVDVKEPKAVKGVSFFWVGAGGALLRNDPRQTELPLRVVADSEAPRRIEEPAEKPRVATA